MADFLVKALYKARGKIYTDLCEEFLRRAPLILDTGLNNEWQVLGEIIRINLRVKEALKNCTSTNRNRTSKYIKRCHRRIVSYLIFLNSNYRRIRSYEHTVVIREYERSDIPLSFWSSILPKCKDTEYIDHLEEGKRNLSWLASLMTPEDDLLKLFTKKSNKKEALRVLRDYLLKNNFSLNGTYFAGKNEVMLPKELVEPFTSLFPGTYINGNLINLGIYRLWDINKELRKTFFNPNSSLT